MDPYIFNLLKYVKPSRLRRWHPNYRVPLNAAKQEFDYVIVGGGSAGCVLASRLSESPDKKVLLLESGDDDNHLFINIPAAMIKLFGTKYCYDYQSVPQQHKNGEKIYLPQGRGLGGSSNINAMAYLRGSKYDWDEWVAAGLKSWNYDEVTKYFKKSERNLRPKHRFAHPDAHGFEGPWKIGDIHQPHPLSKLVIEAFHRELGLPLVDDFNGDRYQPESIGLLQVNIAGGERHSISRAYLSNQVLQRKNLFIRVNSQVTKLLFDKDEKDKVSGVNVDFFDEHGRVRASSQIKAKQVILSSGTINSPRLLLVSGIGPKDTLAQHNIAPVYVNEHVGQHLQDHPFMAMVHLLKDSSLSLDALNSFPQNVIKFLEWVLAKDNELANCAEVTGYIRSNVAKQNNEQAPDLQVGFIKCIYTDHGKQTSSQRAGYALGPILLKPQSKGSVSISGPSIYDPPVIDFNLFGAKSDFERVLDGCKTIQKIIAGPTLSKVNGEGYVVPEPNIKGGDAESWLQEQVRKHTNTLYHPTSTCGMGRVVDEQCGVLGVRGLRVVDASVMPQLIRANTNGPTVMIAEKVADMIKQQQHK